jgi:hypothetical protein
MAISKIDIGQLWMYPSRRTVGVSRQAVPLRVGLRFWPAVVIRFGASTLQRKSSRRRETQATRSARAVGAMFDAVMGLTAAQPGINGLKKAKSEKRKTKSHYLKWVGALSECPTHPGQPIERFPDHIESTFHRQ